MLLTCLAALDKDDGKGILLGRMHHLAVFLFQSFSSFYLYIFTHSSSIPSFLHFPTNPDYWYMGKIPPMGANVAFSLYGALKGQSFSGCSGGTFINSFYTNTGFQSYAAAMYRAKQSGFSDYAYADADDDSSYSGLDAACKGGYGVGCDATYGFAVHKYSTDTCDPQFVTGVKDSLSSLNSAMKNTQCVQIYDSSKSSGSTSGTALALLENANSCFYQNYYSPDGECPDPYGKIAYYRQNFAKGLKKQKREQPYEIYTGEVEKGQSMALAGGLLFLAAAALFIMESYTARKYKTIMSKYQDRPHDPEYAADGLVKSPMASPSSASSPMGGGGGGGGFEESPEKRPKREERS
eukprot:scaffold4823_cov175-Amphora_coffeaeformis.AAC.2